MIYREATDSHSQGMSECASGPCIHLELNSFAPTILPGTKSKTKEF